MSRAIVKVLAASGDEMPVKVIREQVEELLGGSVSRFSVSDYLLTRSKGPDLSSLGRDAAITVCCRIRTLDYTLLVNPAGLIRFRVRPSVLAATIRWLVRRDEASSASLLRRMAGPGADLPTELASWIVLVGRHVRTSLAPQDTAGRAVA